LSAQYEKTRLNINIKVINPRGEVLATDPEGHDSLFHAALGCNLVPGDSFAMIAYFSFVDLHGQQSTSLENPRGLQDKKVPGRGFRKGRSFSL
jgi:hypothetical protein